MALKAIVGEKVAMSQVWVNDKVVPVTVLRAAGLLRRRRLESAAWMVFEVGKNWAEADGEVAWAVDLLEFFARELG